MSATYTSHRIRLRRPYTIGAVAQPIADKGDEYTARYYGRGYPDRVFFDVADYTFSALIGPDAELVHSAEVVAS